MMSLGIIDEQIKVIKVHELYKKIIDIEKDKIHLMCVNGWALRTLIRMQMGHIKDDESQAMMIEAHQATDDLRETTTKIMDKYFNL